MITLTLTTPQAEALRAALSTYHNTLLLELSKADSRDFRGILREREAHIAQIIEQLAPLATLRA